MKIGRKYLFGNGRGNHWPDSILKRQRIKDYQKKIDNAFKYCGKAKSEAAEITNTNVLDSYKKEINAHRHGMKSVNKLRKGLNSKLRQLAKKEINNQLTEE